MSRGSTPGEANDKCIICFINAFCATSAVNSINRTEILTGILKPGFVSVTEYFVKRSGQSYGNTLAIVLNDTCVRSEPIVPIEPRSLKNYVTEMILTLGTIIRKPGLPVKPFRSLAGQSTDTS